LNPEQVAALTAIASIVSKVGTWPIGSIMAAVVFGPWVMLWILSRGMEKPQEAALKMYEDNVKLVENYEKIANGLQDIIVLSTQKMTQVKDRIDNNLFCPLMRKDQKVEKHP